MPSRRRAGWPAFALRVRMPSTRRSRLVSSRSPVAGLSRRNLPFIPVFAQAVAAVAPAGAMSVIPALVFGATGSYLVLSFLLAMVVILLVSSCLRPMAQRMAAVSGLYSYTAKGLGPVAAITAGWSAIFGYGLVAMASLLAVGTYGANILENLGASAGSGTLVVCSTILAAGALAGFFMVRGIRISAKVTLVVECVSILLLAALLTAYFVLARPRVDFASVFSGSDDFHSLSLGVVVAVSAFVGFESSTTLGGEAQRPLINIPRTIRWTPVVTGALYLLAVTGQDIALRDAPASIAASTTPLSDMFHLKIAPFMAVMLDAGIAGSFFACTVASVNALARTLFCMGREGVAPKVIGRAHPAFKTPWTAIVTAIPVVAGVPIVMVLSGVSPEKGLIDLFTLGAYGYLGTYVLASASLPFFLRRIGESTWLSWGMGGLTVGAVVFVVWNAVAVSVQEGNFQAVIYGALITLSVLYAQFLLRHSPSRMDAVGIYDQTSDSDVHGSSPAGWIK
ncbi:putative amino acid permease (plasmid) [Paenarthrobacter aurescens TC1]|uniref:Amino acid permease n=1 Tax=Paenarthrobacter aurescens (strain TC1) TaxID=290340 RepID=A1RDN5_PAEAT|nr:putative amino acid permease [Paenarthrobacter aurescens TC1]